MSGGLLPQPLKPEWGTAHSLTYGLGTPGIDLVLNRREVPEVVIGLGENICTIDEKMRQLLCLASIKMFLGALKEVSQMVRYFL